MSLDHRRGAISSGPARERILCAWDDCEQYGVQLHTIGVQYAEEGSGHSYYVKHLFCSDRHLDYWRNSHRSFGNLPAGSRGGR